MIWFMICYDAIGDDMIVPFSLKQPWQNMGNYGLSNTIVLEIP